MLLSSRVFKINKKGILSFDCSLANLKISSFYITAKPVGSACLCNALFRDTCKTLHRYKKA